MSQTQSTWKERRNTRDPRVFFSRPDYTLPRPGGPHTHAKLPSNHRRMTCADLAVDDLIRQRAERHEAAERVTCASIMQRLDAAGHERELLLRRLHDAEGELSRLGTAQREAAALAEARGAALDRCREKMSKLARANLELEHRAQAAAKREADAARCVEEAASGHMAQATAASRRERSLDQVCDPPSLQPLVHAHHRPCSPWSMQPLVHAHHAAASHRLVCTPQRWREARGKQLAAEEAEKAAQARLEEACQLGQRESNRASRAEAEAGRLQAGSARASRRSLARQLS